MDIMIKATFKKAVLLTDPTKMVESFSEEYHDYFYDTALGDTFQAMGANIDIAYRDQSDKNIVLMISNRMPRLESEDTCKQLAKTIRRKVQNIIIMGVKDHCKYRRVSFEYEITESRK